MFPKGFLWGTSTAGFQFEMGDPRKKNLDPNTDWFKWVHDAQNIRKKVVSGDFPENGINYWELYNSDHDLAKRLGMNAYRLGIEWSRIFPKSTADVDIDVEESSDGSIAKVDLDDGDLERLESVANKEALEHYEMAIDDLINKEFKVIVCLNHFTLPLWIHDPIAARDSRLRKGPRGWYDRETAIEFAKYAAFLAWKLGNKVDMWATLNEPMIVAETGYLLGVEGFPPGITNDLNAFRQVAVNLATAHARSFDMIKKFDTYRADPKSPEPAWIGVIHNVFPVMPIDKSSKKDVEAARFIDRMHNTFFVEATISGWLDINFNGKRDDVWDHLANKLEWLGVNYYTRVVVKGKSSMLAKIIAGISVQPELVPGYGFSCKPNERSLDGRPVSDFGQELYPEGIAEILIEMSKYGKPLYVTENGTADAKDQLRPRHIVEHLRTMEKIIDEDHLDVRGYLHWALTDNYEWARGFGMRFGLFEVNSGSKERIPRRSAEIFHKIIESGTTNGIQF